jgi:hypothetical protein
MAAELNFEVESGLLAIANRDLITGVLPRLFHSKRIFFNTVFFFLSLLFCPSVFLS